jgi:hypothetical protein
MKRDQLLGKDALAKKMGRIKAALESTPIENKTSANARQSVQPKLFINGKLDRKKHRYTLHSLALLDSINSEIKTCCRGGENAILNYLIKEGLSNVKKLKSMLNIEATDIEAQEKK